MTKVGLAAGMAALICFGGAAIAQSPPSTSPGKAPSASLKMTKADCQGIWSKADSSNANSLSASQAQPYVTNFKAVDTNGDGKLSGDEFLAGCEKGMAHDSANSGASSGTSGSDTSAPPAKKY